jgi:hypothetical protein
MHAAFLPEHERAPDAGAHATNCDVTGDYVFHQCQTLEGGDIGQARLGLLPEALAAQCDRTPGCIGFTTSGKLKFKAAGLSNITGCRAGGDIRHSSPERPSGTPRPAQVPGGHVRLALMPVTLTDAPACLPALGAALGAGPSAPCEGAYLGSDQESQQRRWLGMHHSATDQKFMWLARGKAPSPRVAAAVETSPTARVAPSAWDSSSAASTGG